MKKSISFILVMLMVLCMVPGVALAAAPWDGTADKSWYDASKTEFVLTTAEQLAGLSALSFDDGITFEGKTIKLGANIDLNGTTTFQPINLFKGTFDGDGYIIENLRIFMYEIKDPSNRYIGLFRTVEDATVKNLIIKKASLEPYWEDPWYYYSAEMATVASMANGTCLFENITVVESTAQTYNNTVGGVVGEVYGNTTLRNVVVDDTNTFGAYWQTYDARVGGLVGYLGSDPSYSLTFENCVSAPNMDVYNDVCGNYQWYVYRYCGMLLGEAKGYSESSLPDGRITVTNCQVAFDTWNQYTYCEFISNGHPSYSGPDDYKFSRSDKVDPNHTHLPEEDNHLVELPFTNLVGFSTGNGKIDIEDAEEKFPSLAVTESGGYTATYVDKEAPAPAPAPNPSSGSGISITYNGGNSFSTSKSDVPTGVEIDNVPVSFTGNGNNFTVSGIPAGAKWITVRWNSTSVTTNFTPNGAYFAEVEIPKTGDMPFWAAIAEFLGF